MEMLASNRTVSAPNSPDLEAKGALQQQMGQQQMGAMSAALGEPKISVQLEPPADPPADPPARRFPAGEERCYCGSPAIAASEPPTPYEANVPERGAASASATSARAADNGARAANAVAGSASPVTGAVDAMYAAGAAVARGERKPTVEWM